MAIGLGPPIRLVDQDTVAMSRLLKGAKGKIISASGWLV